jgi:hypothetical protein
MRALRVIALSALLLTTSATAAFASADVTYALPSGPTTEIVREGDGGGYALPGRPTHEAAREGDGGGYALPMRPSNETVREGDGGGYTVPTQPADQTEWQRWV